MVLSAGKDPSSHSEVSVPKWDYGTSNTPGIIYLGVVQDITTSSNQDLTGPWQIVPGLNDSRQDDVSTYGLKAQTTDL